MNKFAKDTFLEELTEVLRFYTIDGLTDYERKIAHTPARSLETLLDGFFILGLQGTEEQRPMSCRSDEDLLEVIKIIDKVASTFLEAYGSEVYRLTFDGIKALNLENKVYPPYIVPFVISCIAKNMLIPVIKDSDKMFYNKVDFKKKPIK